jgi:hypothetical protein
VLPLDVAQRIAESVVGVVRWEGAQGVCRCPGFARHTTSNASTDCKVVCAPVALGSGTLAPGVYCFHGTCAPVVEAVSRELRSALGRRQGMRGRSGRRAFLFTAKAPEPVFDPARLEQVAARLGEGVDADWLALRSKKRVDNRTPASFLHELYRPGEKVVVFDVFESQGQALWTHRAPPFDACELDGFVHGKPRGVWFLANPVTGEFVPNDRGKRSRRSWQTVTAWRYLVLESDTACPAHWLAALAQMPLPVAAIYTSGGKSIHALIRVDAQSKAHWDEIAATLKPALITLGADRRAISAVRLTRLPCCQRVEKGQWQELLYLNGAPDGTPICEQEIL